MCNLSGTKVFKLADTPCLHIKTPVECCIICLHLCFTDKAVLGIIRHYKLVIIRSWFQLIVF